MVVMNEYFFKNIQNQYAIDLNLPLRQQKRILLSALGFPCDPMLKACPSCDTNKIDQLLKEYCAQGCPFLIIVSEKPMLTLVQPLFIVNNINSVQWRNNQGVKQIINLHEALTVVKNYPKSTWVEFSPYLWGEYTIAGRLMYISAENQILEMQQGVSPTKLVNDCKLMTYVGELSFLETEKHQYVQHSCCLRSMGYSNIFPFSVVQSVCRKMPRISSFESLLLIGKFPTLEFAFRSSGQLIAIDIDWPSQWIKKKGNICESI